MSIDRKLTDKKFLDELAEYTTGLRDLIIAECDGFENDEKASKERIEISSNDLGFFSRTYFPHYVNSEPSVFHDYAFSELLPKIKSPRGMREAIAAPRGEAKSTIVTQILTLFCIVFELKHYIGIIMDTIEQSAQMLEAIKIELDENPRLAMDYPDACGVGRKWTVSEIITANSRKVKIGSSGKRLRGWKYGPNRPDLIVLDDLENDENVKKPEQRKKLENWIKKTVMKLGPPKGTMDILYVGTILHYDSVLVRFMKLPTWNGRKFKAIIKWPDNMKLWQRWEEILNNQGEPEADEFYNKNKKAMDKGSEVSWPNVRPLELLMKMRSDDHGAFESEMQNSPSNSENALFDTITFWVEPKKLWRFFGAVDPSLGKNNKGRDPSAILVGGFDPSTGILDVVEADITRRLPDKIISDIIMYQQEYNCITWGIESVQFQEFLRTELVKRSAKLHTPVPAIPIIPSTDKVMRIEALQPHVFNGLIRLHPSQTDLKEQLEYFPDAEHDDGPDALEMLWKIALKRGGNNGMPVIKTSRRFRDRLLKNY